MSSTTTRCTSSSLCRAGESPPGHGGQQALHGGRKVHLKWAGHELPEEDNLLWLAGQWPGQTSACAGCDKGEESCKKASCVPLPVPQLSGEMKCIFPSSLSASSLQRVPSVPGAPHVRPRLPSRGAERQGCPCAAPPRDTFPGGVRRAAQAAMWSREGLPCAGCLMQR